MVISTGSVFTSFIAHFPHLIPNHKVYIGVATDACNATSRTRPCVDGQSIEVWRAPKLMSPPPEWEALGSMFTTKDDMMTRNTR
jgi:hypothetical protein